MCRLVANGVGCDVRKNTYIMNENDSRRREWLRKNLRLPMWVERPREIDGLFNGFAFVRGTADAGDKDINGKLHPVDAPCNITRSVVAVD